MRRIWAAVAATLTVALILAVLVALARDGSVRDHWMRTGIPGEGDGGRPAMVAPRHMSSFASNEYDYLTQMIAHHEEAIAAAGELTRSDRAQMREFGIGIATSQTAQVDQMTAWLHRWYPDRPQRDASYLPEMRDLTGLSGDRLDRAFLTDMVWHHMMAVMASQQLLMMGAVEHDEVAELASTIRDEQRTEIVQMQSWLRAWFRAG